MGIKKSGKTALVSALVRQLSGFGTVGTVKHMGEQRLNPGETDTGRHFDAGADMVIGITGTELVSFARDSDLEDALDMLCDRGLDFAVVEGFKGSNLPKIAIGDVEGVSNVVIRIPENIDPHEELTASLVGISLVQPDHYTLEALIKKARKNPDIRKAGAIGTFSGIVRELAGEEKTSRLEFEKYEPEASKVLDRIRDEIKQKEGILEVLIHHKAGVIEAGEDIVYIVIASAHRTELFPALSEAIERVKAEAPIWKKEFTEKEEFWVHDREHA
ncbi:molybdopterin synthase [Methanosarcina horonobensis]|uniref:molybdopterin synthase n=1 Tax=Methanosarcina horonobensis TaxID=418008 RepID=UPI000AAEFCA1|nr:molybdopterin synthase [Methanosarcina horonobensis]